MYDSTKTIAKQIAEKNKFEITGEFKATKTNEIILGATHIPQGSVVVTAGGQTLIEGTDYTADDIEIAKTYERAYQQGWKDADSHPNWIPVEEELPKEKGKYMFKLSNGDMYYATYYPKLKLLGNVTHWMEIVPPQGKEE